MYLLDEDLTSTSYKTFHTDHESIYPSINLCFGDIRDNDSLTAHEWEHDKTNLIITFPGPLLTTEFDCVFEGALFIEPPPPPETWQFA